MDEKLIYRPPALSSRFVASPLDGSRIQYGLLGISASLRFNAKESGFDSSVWLRDVLAQIMQIFWGTVQWVKWPEVKADHSPLSCD
jgi:hypothetical protein